LLDPDKAYHDVLGMTSDGGTGGKLEYIFTSCGGGTGGGQKGTDTPSTGDDGFSNCTWDQNIGGPIYPGDSRRVNFKYANNFNANQLYLGELYECICIETDVGEDVSIATITNLDFLNQDGETVDKPDPFVCFRQHEDRYDIEDCRNKEAIAYYSKGNEFLRLSFDYNFSYFVNASLPVEIMNGALLDDKLASNEIKLESIVSEYQGGPVKLAIWTQEQPIREGEWSFGQLSITNQLRGTVHDDVTKVNLYIPIVGSAVEIRPFFENGLTCTAGGTPDIPEFIGNYEFITCTLDRDLKEDKLASYEFEFRYANIPVETTSVIFVASTNYHYTGIGEKEFQIQQLPVQ
jgi:hypothetical protein